MIITLDDAWDIILDNVSPLPAVTIDLSESLNHVLAEPVCAERENPPADRSAMDGYAVRAEDLATIPATLKLRGEVPAGCPDAPQVEPGSCIAVFTGASLPPGADTVVKIEETETLDNGEIKFLKQVKKAGHIRRCGENARQGEELIPGGTYLTPSHISVCASEGCHSPKVHRRPAASILVTGRELRSVSDVVESHQIRNSNGPMLEAALAERGFAVNHSEVVPDEADATREAIINALERSDMVIVVGGMSVGKYDFVPKAIEYTGSTIHFHGVSMKPGKPQLFATSDSGQCIFGLPGNPLSAMVGFHELVLPTLNLLSGMSPSACHTTVYARITKEVAPTGGRQRFLLGKLRWIENTLQVDPVSNMGSGDLVSGSRADGVIVVPTGKAVNSGDFVTFRLWRTVL